MKKTSSRKLTVVSVSVLVIVALLLLLVPGVVTGSDDPPILSYVGIVYQTDLDICWMINPVPVNGEYLSQPLTKDIFIAPPGSDLPPEAPVDDIALLRCKTTFSEYNGPALVFSGGNAFGCWAYYQYYVDDNPVLVGDLTSTWTQAISANGEATLTCHYRSHR